MCAKIAGGPDKSVGGTLFREIQRPYRWVPDVRWRKLLFCMSVHFRCRWWVHFRCMSFVDHVDHAAPSASKVVDDG